mmetsp:Transcript_827/g.1827  ORF Transcript_827/g.1827 Transcript_827/m.1827 type:complete len:114 (-) Transcript_827:4122-4463(-)
MAEFHESFCGFTRNLKICLLVSCVPCGYCWVQSYSASYVSGEPQLKRFCLVLLLSCLGAGLNRRRVRQMFLIEGNLCSDCLMHWFCCLCAATQEYREVMRRVGPRSTYSLMVS